MLAVKHILRYLRHSSSSQLILGSKAGSASTVPLSALHVLGWFDASWADDPDDRRSTFGYALTYGDLALLWKSKKTSSHHTINYGRGGARLYLHAVRPGNFLSSAEDANRVSGCFQVCFPSVGGLETGYA